MFTTREVARLTGFASVQKFRWFLYRHPEFYATTKNDLGEWQYDQVDVDRINNRKRGRGSTVDRETILYRMNPNLKSCPTVESGSCFQLFGAKDKRNWRKGLRFLIKDNVAMIVTASGHQYQFEFKPESVHDQAMTIELSEFYPDFKVTVRSILKQFVEFEKYRWLPEFLVDLFWSQTPVHDVALVENEFLRYTYSQISTDAAIELLGNGGMITGKKYIDIADHVGVVLSKTMREDIRPMWVGVHTEFTKAQRSVFLEVAKRLV